MKLQIYIFNALHLLPVIVAIDLYSLRYFVLPNYSKLINY